MIAVTYLNGNQVQIEGDEWSANNGVFQVGTWFAPIAHIAYWEEVTVQPPVIDVPSASDVAEQVQTAFAEDARSNINIS